MYSISFLRYLSPPFYGGVIFLPWLIHSKSILLRPGMNRDNIDSVVANNYPCPPGAMAHYAVGLRTDNPLYIFNRIARSHHLGKRSRWPPL